MLERLPGPIRRWLYAGGTRADRLRDPDAVVAFSISARDDRRRPWAGLRAPPPSPGRSSPMASSTRSTRARGNARRPGARRRRAWITTFGQCGCRATASRLPEPSTSCSSRPPTTTPPGPNRLLRGRGEPTCDPARVAILESRGEGLLARWQAFHATSSRELKREMADAGYPAHRHPQPNVKQYASTPGVEELDLEPALGDRPGWRISWYVPLVGDHPLPSPSTSVPWAPPATGHRGRPGTGSTPLGSPGP